MNHSYAAVQRWELERDKEAYTVHEDIGRHRQRRNVKQAFVRFNQFRLHLLSNSWVQLFAKQPISFVKQLHCIGSIGYLRLL